MSSTRAANDDQQTQFATFIEQGHSDTTSKEFEHALKLDTYSTMVMQKPLLHGLSIAHGKPIAEMRRILIDQMGQI